MNDTGDYVVDVASFAEERGGTNLHGFGSCYFVVLRRYEYGLEGNMSLLQHTLELEARHPWQTLIQDETGYFLIDNMF
ncbi:MULTISPECIES: hypothetical protein [unclassified Rhizobium]|uniref:hypothetical protein n=1 Tax=unclassified Rhizobium TaxID=2613769 RepID=UPI001FD7E7BD|nr:MULTISPECIES: hypothetical protein [unclassified Rhizobium]